MSAINAMLSLSDSLAEKHKTDGYEIVYQPLFRAMQEALLHPYQPVAVRQHLLAKMQGVLLSAPMQGSAALQRAVFDDVLFPLAEDLIKRPTSRWRHVDPAENSTAAVISLMCRSFLHFLTTFTLGSDKSLFWSLHKKEDAVIAHLWLHLLYTANDVFAVSANLDHLV